MKIEFIVQKFRATQKAIDQAGYYFKKEWLSLDTKLKRSNDADDSKALSVSDIATETHRLLEILKKAQSVRSSGSETRPISRWLLFKEMEKGCNDEIMAAELLRDRAEYLRQVV